MGVPKLGKSSTSKEMHYSVGAVIEKDGKYLLIDRAKFPFGFAGPAGHVDQGEVSEQTIVREVKEETGLDVNGYKQVAEEEVYGDVCRRGVTVHYWNLFKCETTGEIVQNVEETKSIGWYTPDEMKKMELQPLWIYWFKKLNVL